MKYIVRERNIITNQSLQVIQTDDLQSAQTEYNKLIDWWFEFKLAFNNSNIVIELLSDNTCIATLYKFG
jgi:hypothetical protein